MFNLRGAQSAPSNQPFNQPSNQPFNQPSRQPTWTGGSADIEKWYNLPVGTHITYDIANKPGLDGVIINKWIPDQGQFKGKHFFKMEGKGKYTWSLMLEDVLRIHGQGAPASHLLSHPASHPLPPAHIQNQPVHNSGSRLLDQPIHNSGQPLSNAQLTEKIESMEKEIQLLRKNLANLVAAVTGLIVERRPQVKQL